MWSRKGSLWDRVTGRKVMTEWKWWRRLSKKFTVWKIRFVFLGVQSSNLSNKEFNLGLSPFPIWFLFTLERDFFSSAGNNSSRHCCHKHDSPSMNVMPRLCFHSMRKMQVCAAASGSEPRLFIPLKTFWFFQKHWWSTEQKPTVVIKCKWLTSSFKKKEITILLQPASRAALSLKHHDWRLCSLCKLRNHLPPCQPWLSQPFSSDWTSFCYVTCY